jgi:hypothetical protein
MSGETWQERLMAAGKQASDRASEWVQDLEGNEPADKSQSAVSRIGGSVSSRRKFSDATYVGTLRVSNAAARAIARISNPGESPWLMVGTGIGLEGVLVAFEDRLAIIKTGLLTSAMAGSLGGERTTVIDFTDITGIEYNSGIFNGVLEVLTASYEGSTNKDFWRGKRDPRNSNSNDPHTLSNTLPLNKLDYKKGAAAIQDLRSRISKAKRRETSVVANVTVPDGAPSRADELKKFAELLAVGAITQDEFDAAKQRILDTL